MKGIVHVLDNERPLILQAVRELYDLIEAPSAALHGKACMSRVVVIGRNLDAESLQSTLQHCK
jgi:G3E family GTPase